MVAVIDVNAENFEEIVLKSDVPVMVDFWAPWCGPCKVVIPMLPRLANQFEGQAKICKINIDDAPGIAAEYNIRSVPSMLMFKSGVLQSTKVGALTQSQLNAFVESAL
jgi:thioredoxin 1